MRWMGLALAASFLLPPSARAVEYEGPVYTYYDVFGTPAEIVQQMKMKGRDGAFGYTEYHIDYRFSSAQSPQGCGVTAATVTLHVSILLPRLVGEVSPDLQRSWDAFEPNLRVHEAGHEAIGMTGAKEVETALLAVGGQPNCAATRAAAKAAADAIFAELGNRDQSYDKQTEHGKTQGAVFRWIGKN